MGLTDETLRDMSSPRHWRGLSGDDAALLATWLSRPEVKADELHTGIPVGRLPEIPAEFVSPMLRRVQEGTSSWRVDAAVRFGPDWWVIECKPDAGHYALGQLIFYRHWWCRHTGYPDVSRWVILTDECDVDIISVAESYGLEVIQLGEVLEFSRRRRRRVGQ
jgi:hypothetical protein